MFFYKMWNKLRVGIRNEGVTFRNKVLSELLPVLDDAVVYEPDLSLAIRVRMRIHVRRLTGGRPAQMRDTAFPLEPFRDFLSQLGNSPRRLHSPAFRREDARRVVAAVFKRRQSLQKDLAGVFCPLPRVRKNTAHTHHTKWHCFCNAIKHV